MKDALKDPRTKKLMKELSRRLPGTTLVTRRWHDEPDSGEIIVEVLNAPSPAWKVVDAIARPLIWKLWGDGPHPVSVTAVGPKQSAKEYAAGIALLRRAVRRRPAPRRKRTAAR